ncbi:hypothetical protein FGO68_gene17386 [Halteria grandinella]|uniref:Uncharacterized protein n=1 Tax=Halteria grandinella TaxID=5974 RepID=A0A8J8NPI3_HALGN|nr:hypothetical protein FGO68_gene17386 [Halteria grandinella]
MKSFECQMDIFIQQKLKKQMKLYNKYYGKYEPQQPIKFESYQGFTKFGAIIIHYIASLSANKYCLHPTCINKQTDQSCVEFESARRWKRSNNLCALNEIKSESQLHLQNDEVLKMNHNQNILQGLVLISRLAFKSGATVLALNVVFI